MSGEPRGRRDWADEVEDLDFSAAQRDMQKLQGGEGNNDTLDCRYMLKFDSDQLPSGKYDQGQFAVRFLPVIKNARHGRMPYYVVHYFTLYDYELGEIACESTIKDERDVKDPLTSLKFEFYKLAKANGGKEHPIGKIYHEAGNSLQPKRDLFFLGLMRLAELFDERNGKREYFTDVGPKVGRLPRTTAEAVIIPGFGSKRNGNPADIYEGRDLLIKRTFKKEGEKKWPQYDGTQWDVVQTPISKSEDKIDDVFDAMKEMEAKGEGLYYEYEKRLKSPEEMAEAAEKVREIVESRVRGGGNSARQQRHRETEDGDDRRPLESSDSRSGRSRASELVDDEPRGRNRARLEEDTDRRPPRDYDDRDDRTERSSRSRDDRDREPVSETRSRSVDNGDDDRRRDEVIDRGRDDRESRTRPADDRDDDRNRGRDESRTERARPADDRDDDRRRDNRDESPRAEARTERARPVDDRDDDRRRDDRDDDRGRGRDDSPRSETRPEAKTRDADLDDDEELYRKQFDQKVESGSSDGRGRGRN